MGKLGHKICYIRENRSHLALGPVDIYCAKK